MQLHKETVLIPFLYEDAYKNPTLPKTYGEVWRGKNYMHLHRELV
jgi:hypothetical protein